MRNGLVCKLGRRFADSATRALVCKISCGFAKPTAGSPILQTLDYSANHSSILHKKSLQTRDSLSAKRLVCKISCLFCRLASLMSHQLCCSSICCLWLCSCSNTRTSGYRLLSATRTTAYFLTQACSPGCSSSSFHCHCPKQPSSLMLLCFSSVMNCDPR